MQRFCFDMGRQKRVSTEKGHHRYMWKMISFRVQKQKYNIRLNNPKNTNKNPMPNLHHSATSTDILNHSYQFPNPFTLFINSILYPLSSIYTTPPLKILLLHQFPHPHQLIYITSKHNLFHFLNFSNTAFFPFYFSPSFYLVFLRTAPTPNVLGNSLYTTALSCQIIKFIYPYPN